MEAQPLDCSPGNRPATAGRPLLRANLAVNPAFFRVAVASEYFLPVTSGAPCAPAAPALNVLIATPAAAAKTMSLFRRPPTRSERSFPNLAKFSSHRRGNWHESPIQARDDRPMTPAVGGWSARLLAGGSTGAPPQVATTTTSPGASRFVHPDPERRPRALAGDPTFADFPRAASDRDTMLTIG